MGSKLSRRVFVILKNMEPLSLQLYKKHALNTEDRKCHNNEAHPLLEALKENEIRNKQIQNKIYI